MKNHVVCFFSTALALSAIAQVPDDPAAFQKSCEEDLAQAEQIFRGLEKLEGPKTVESVLTPLNEMEIILANTASKAGLFYNVHPSQEIRDIAEKHQEDLTKLYSEINLSRPLYEAVKSVDASGADATTQRYLERTLRDFRRSGVDKPDDVRERIKKLHEELTDLGQAFSLNVRKDVRSITLDSVDDLKGLPEDYIAAHQPDENGKITITTDYPDYMPFMQYAENDAARLAIYKEFKNRAYPENADILNTVLEKRYELANLVGYPNYAYFVTETKMVESPETVHTFIDKVTRIADTRAKAEYQVLLERLKQIDPDADEVGDWQKTYLEDLIKKEKYDVDAKEIRSYFPFGAVRDGIFKLTTALYGVTFRPWDTDVWHEDVKAYELVDGDQVIARFYLDLHPRENKYKHAAHFDLQVGVKDKQLPISALVCNFPGKGDESALMEHRQVETFLHEFGHLLHHLFAGDHRWARFSGIATELDFVEAPSQMLEEWVWNADTLKLMTRNAEGETIPPELVERMVAAKEFGTGMWVRHQMFYAATSIDIYDRDPKDIDLAATMNALQDEYSLFKHVPDTHMYANFGHLYGYSAMYCTYMWSMVIAKDMYSRFETEGMMNKETAADYRRAILSQGGSKDAVDLVKEFLGRPYGFEPFAQWLNAPAE